MVPYVSWSIILFILIAYVTYLFSNNMAIVLLVALLLTNLFLGSNKIRREGMTDGSDSTDETDATDSADVTDGSGNHPIAAKVKNVIAEKKDAVAPSTAPSTVVPSTTSTPATVAPAVAPSADGFKNIQNLDLDKMNSLLTKSKELMNELKTSFPGMSNILGGTA